MKKRLSCLHPLKSIAPACLVLFSSMAQAAPIIEVNVISEDGVSTRTHFELSEYRKSFDLRDSTPYSIALRDEARNRDVCREADYRTGLFLTFRDTGQGSANEHVLEVVGQVTSLNSAEPGETLSCGQNTVVDLTTTAFSDTSSVMPGTPKVIVIDNSWTVFLTVRD